MTKKLGPITSGEEYRSAVARLARRLASDPQARALAAEVERIVQFELQRGVPEGERLSARLVAAEAPPARRTAIISDIHGHYVGLEAVLADIERQRCDRIVCLGDLVEGGPDNERVISALLDLRVPCVMGNHDEINDVGLPESWRQVLQALPESIEEGEAFYTHISPRQIKRKINHAIEAWNVFEETPYRFVFVGHVHVPYLFGKRSTSYGEASKLEFEYNRPYALSADDRYIVSVGAVAYGRDQVGKIRYGILDRDAMTVELRAIEGPVLPLDYAQR